MITNKCDFCTEPCDNDHCPVKDEPEIYYDPPSGWRYGFPKIIPSNVVTGEDFKKWLIDSGYPEKDIDFALKYGRRWSE